MARPLRIEFPGAFYHITSRGDRREVIFEDDGDHNVFLELMQEVCERFHWRCHSYCLMSNHYHFIVETLNATLSKGMRHLNGVYTQRFNRRHNRVGHVFQGRFHAVLVQKEVYLKELSRYVVLNPVRAGMVKRVDQWPWGSYRAMIGKVFTPPWLDTQWTLSQFGSTQQTARKYYSQFVKQGKDQPSVWTHLRQQMFLGDDHFVQCVLKESLDTDRDYSEIPQRQRTLPPNPLTYYASSYQDQREAMRAAYATGGYTLRAIADFFGVHYSTVSRAVRKRA